MLHHITEKRKYVTVFLLQKKSCYTSDIHQIKRMVSIGRTYKPILAINHPRSMFSFCINHFVNMESKQLLATPVATLALGS
jgi:hypothetical protein